MRTIWSCELFRQNLARDGPDEGIRGRQLLWNAGQNLTVRGRASYHQVGLVLGETRCDPCLSMSRWIVNYEPRDPRGMGWL